MVHMVGGVDARQFRAGRRPERMNEPGPQEERIRSLGWRHKGVVIAQNPVAIGEKIDMASVVHGQGAPLR